MLSLERRAGRKAPRRAKHRLQVIPGHMEKPKQKLNLKKYFSLFPSFSQLKNWANLHLLTLFRLVSGAGLILGDAWATFLFVWPLIEQSGSWLLVEGLVAMVLPAYNGNTLSEAEKYSFQKQRNVV